MRSRLHRSLYRQELITELGILFKFLQSLLQSFPLSPSLTRSPATLSSTKLEILHFFHNLYSITEYLVDACVNSDNKESPFNPVTELIDWCGDYVAQYKDGRNPTPEELRVASEGSDLLKMIAKEVVDAANSISSSNPAAESPIEEVTELYKSTRGRVPSHITLESDLYGSAISPYGQGVTKEALALAKEKGVKKCIARLIASRVIERTAEGIVKFIFLYLPQLDEVELGDYLGSDGGTTSEERNLMDQIRYRFLRSRGVWA